MQALQIINPGPEASLELTDYPLPAPGPGQLRIAVSAAGINRADLFQMAGTYPLPEGASPVPGLEVAGRVDAVGKDVKGWREGDAVMTLVDGGGYATHTLAEAGLCMPIPAELNMTQAAAMPEALMTNWMVLADRARLQNGESVLFYGGASGIGTMGIQIARALGAGAIYAMVSTEEKAALCEELGAKAVRYKEQSAPDVINEWTEGKGVNVILDMAGSGSMSDTLSMAARYGRIVTIASLAGVEAPIKSSALMRKYLTWMGAMLRPLPLEVKSRFVAEIQDVLGAALAEGRIRPVIDSTFPLSQAAQALEKMRHFRHKGKIILEVA